MMLSIIGLTIIVLLFFTEKVNALSMIRSMTKMSMKMTEGGNDQSVVVLGQGSKEVRYITAKLASRRGMKTSYILTENEVVASRKLMYGLEYGKSGIDEEGYARPAVTGQEIGDALQSATTLAIVNDDPANSLDKQRLDLIMGAVGDDVRRIVLMSRMGVSRSKKQKSGGSSFFGGLLGGGGDASLFETEQTIQKEASDRGIGVSIVRTGVLKGGGPGKVESGEVVSGIEYGLSKEYYNALFDIQTAYGTMAYDKFTLGASCVKGDPFELSNALERMGNKASFEPKQDETSRIIAAEAIIAAILHNEEIEFTVSSAKAEVPPTPEEWTAILNKL